MGKERPFNLVRLRIRGPEVAVKQVMEKLLPLLEDGLVLVENKQGCRVGRSIRISGQDYNSRKPQAEVHMQVPVAVVLGTFRTQQPPQLPDLFNTVGQTT